jgi:hypothetical protein
MVLKRVAENIFLLIFKRVTLQPPFLNISVIILSLPVRGRGSGQNIRNGLGIFPMV